MALRVLHILDSMAPGQVQEDVVRLIGRLSGEHMRHIVCVCGQAGGLSDRLEMDVDFVSLDLDIGDKATANCFAKVIRHHQPDVVHARQPNLWSDTIKACRRTGHRGALLSYHGTDIETDMGWIQRRRHARMYRSMARAGFANSSPAAQTLARMLRIDPSVVPVVFNGVDTRQFHPDAKTHPEDSGTIHWGAVGRLAPANNWPLVVRVVRRLRDAGIEIHLDIIGDGPAHDELQTCIVDHDLEASLAMLGTSARRDWYMRQWDAFLLTSMRDELGYGALLEAMSSGLGVVAVGSPGGFGPIQPEKNGLPAYRDNESQLFDAMKRISTDQELRRSLGQAARQTVLREYADTATAEKVAWIYEWVASHPGRGIDDFIEGFARFEESCTVAAK